MTLRSDVLREFDRLQADLLDTEKTHFTTAQLAKRAHYILGGAAVVFSTIAAASVTRSSPAIAATFALLSTLAAALLTFAKPQVTSDLHLRAGRALGALRFEIRQAEKLDGHADSGVSDAELRALAALFAHRKAQAHRDAPPTGDLAFWLANRKIDKGQFEYSADLEETAEPIEEFKGGRLDA